VRGERAAVLILQEVVLYGFVLLISTPAVTNGAIILWLLCVDELEELELARTHVDQSTGHVRTCKPRTLAGVMMR
jgi:hypothetical protein